MHLARKSQRNLVEKGEEKCQDGQGPATKEPTLVSAGDFS